jgi:hypothetical protein
VVTCDRTIVLQLLVKQQTTHSRAYLALIAITGASKLNHNHDFNTEGFALAGGLSEHLSWSQKYGFAQHNGQEI